MQAEICWALTAPPKECLSEARAVFGLPLVAGPLPSVVQPLGRSRFHQWGLPLWGPFWCSVCDRFGEASTRRNATKLPISTVSRWPRRAKERPRLVARNLPLGGTPRRDIRARRQGRLMAETDSSRSAPTSAVGNPADHCRGPLPTIEPANESRQDVHAADAWLHPRRCANAAVAPAANPATIRMSSFTSTGSRRTVPAAHRRPPRMPSINAPPIALPGCRLTTRWLTVLAALLVPVGAAQAQAPLAAKPTLRLQTAGAFTEVVLALLPAFQT